MGQAKARGTYTERQVAATSKAALEEAERKEAEAKAEAALTPEQRKARADGRKKIMELLAAVTAVSHQNL